MPSLAVQFHPAQPRFSSNSFIDSFGGRNSMKGNQEDRSWHQTTMLSAVFVTNPTDSLIPGPP